MSLYTFGEALPLAGSSASLITAAIASPYPLKPTELAKRAKISRYAASRVIPDLIERQLLTNDELGLLAFNDNHDLAKLLRSMAWRFSGVTRPDISTARYHYPRRGDWSDEYHYQPIIPESLRSKNAPVTTLHDRVGPDLVTARDFKTWADEISWLLGVFHWEGQRGYAHWSNERLRDVIHQTLRFGSALAEAAREVVEECTDEAQGEHDPRTVNMSGQVWARATYLISAEVRDVLRVVQIMDTAIYVGTRVNGLHSDALRALNHLNDGSNGTDLGHLQEIESRDLRRGLTAEAEADALWNDNRFGPYRNLGGTPSPHDIGTAGDQVLAVRLMNLSQQLSDQVEKMASHPSLALWAQLHPDEAAEYELVTKMPEQPLRGRRDWPKTTPPAGPGAAVLTRSGGAAGWGSGCRRRGRRGGALRGRRRLCRHWPVVASLA